LLPLILKSEGLNRADYCKISSSWGFSFSGSLISSDIGNGYDGSGFVEVEILRLASSTAFRISSSSSSIYFSLRFLSSSSARDSFIASTRSLSFGVVFGIFF
jgi:hypothetical protein